VLGQRCLSRARSSSRGGGDQPEKEGPAHGGRRNWRRGEGRGLILQKNGSGEQEKQRSSSVAVLVLLKGPSSDRRRGRNVKAYPDPGTKILPLAVVTCVKRTGFRTDRKANDSERRTCTKLSLHGPAILGLEETHVRPGGVFRRSGRKDNRRKGPIPRVVWVGGVE